MRVSAVAFGDEAQTFLDHVKGGALAISGRAQFNTWTTQDGRQQHGLSIVVAQIASPSSRPR